MQQFPLAKNWCTCIDSWAHVVQCRVLQQPGWDPPWGSRATSFIRNVAEFKDLADLTENMKSFNSDMKQDGARGPVEREGDRKASRKSSSTTATSKTLFEGEHRWLHFLYLGILLLAIVGVFVPSGHRLLIAMGVAGIGGLFFFIHRFNQMVMEESEQAELVENMVKFDWDTGAIVAAIGFALFVVDGIVGVPKQPDRARSSNGTS